MYAQFLQIQAYTEPAVSHLMSPSLPSFVSVCRDHPVHLWDAYTGALRASYTAYNHLVSGGDAFRGMLQYWAVPGSLRMKYLERFHTNSVVEQAYLECMHTCTILIIVQV